MSLPEYWQGFGVGLVTGSVIIAQLGNSVLPWVFVLSFLLIIVTFLVEVYKRE